MIVLDEKLLRDYFAGLAMQGIVGSIRDETDYLRLKRLARPETVSTWIARDAYKQAEAMLRERALIDLEKGGAE